MHSLKSIISKVEWLWLINANVYPYNYKMQSRVDRPNTLYNTVCMYRGRLMTAKIISSNNNGIMYANPIIVMNHSKLYRSFPRYRGVSCYLSFEGSLSHYKTDQVWMMNDEWWMLVGYLWVLIMLYECCLVLEWGLLSTIPWATLYFITSHHTQLWC